LIGQFSPVFVLGNCIENLLFVLIRETFLETLFVQNDNLAQELARIIQLLKRQGKACSRIVELGTMLNKSIKQ
jgi:hypothetical protein